MEKADWMEIARTAAEEHGWRMEREEGWIELQTYSEEGEDYWMTTSASSPSEFRNGIAFYARNFDPEEHAAMWWGAGNGEPSSLRALLDDAEGLARKMDELLGAVEAAFREHGIRC